MADYIAIDMGTSNTRINLVCDYTVTDSVKLGMGAGVGIDNKELLKSNVKEGILKLLKRNPGKTVKCIIASGMITSEGGFVSLEHIKTPCGIKELKNGIYKTFLSDISPLPFVFIRGIKTDSDDFSTLDMMRGEEAEIVGLSEKIEPMCVYVMPGSHSKIVHTDEYGRIKTFSTELTGELMAAISGSTILKNSVSLNGEISMEYLEKGYLYSKEHGMNAALFKVRVLDKLMGCKSEDVLGFFKGVVLAPEIENIIKATENKVIICGKRVLREPMAYLVSKFSDKEIISVTDEVAENAPPTGAVRIYEYSE